MADSATTGLHLVPSLRYRDAPAAIKWLHDAFGFEEHHTADGRPAGLQMPAAVELGVVETEPGVRGDTVSSVTKPATLETGAVVQVPLFVNVGDRIKVDTRERRYISRA